MTDAARFSWLHLTDLHVGLGAGAYLWPNVRDRTVFPDLDRLHKSCGPWDAVFFTGDLTQKGARKEFEALDLVLADLRAHLKKLGSEPVILAVPGNHDLVRPDERSGTLKLAQGWSDDEDLREQFWNESKPKPDGLRRGVMNAFSGWVKWWRSFSKKETRVEIHEGLLPGDFRTTIEVQGLRIGVIGLNTAFLQLQGGDLERKLSLDARQIHALYKTGGDRWAEEHDACFLLTHHPPNWLDSRGQEALKGEIAPIGRFALHLYGHQHEGRVLLLEEGGAKSRLEVLGRALFGLEHWGQARERLHGYSAGEIHFDGLTRKLRLLPREGRKQQSGHWEMRADGTCSLDENEALCKDLGENPRRRAAASSAAASAPLNPTGPVKASNTTLAPASMHAASTPTSLRTTLVAAPGPLGWTLLDDDLLAAEEVQANLSPQALKLYFDGQVPRLRHALCSGIPRRAFVLRLVNELQRRADAKTATMALLLGGGGEGKTTLLLQVAVDLARASNGWKVLLRPNDAPLKSEEVLGLPPGPWLLVADHADGIVGDLNNVVRVLHRAGRGDVHLLLAARDTDWRHAGGLGIPWDSHIALLPETTRGIEDADARAVVRAWTKLGNDGLGAIAGKGSEDQQVAALLDAVKNNAGRGDGSFFGGVLQVRFDAAGLRAHVLALMNRLAQRTITEGRTLLEAFLFVAALDAVEFDGIDSRVLADFIGISRGQVGVRVIQALGDEAAAVQAGEKVRTRHRSIARAALRLAESGAVDADVAELFAQVVRQAKRTNDSGVFVDRLTDVLHIGPLLIEKLPPELSDDRRAQIAITAARASIEADPSRLSSHVTLARTWRALNQPAKGAEALRAIAPRVDTMVDRNAVVRGLWYEWAVCEGVSKNHALNVLLAGVSLSDELNPADMSLEDAKLGLAGLGAALRDLVKHDPIRAFLRGLRAVAVLGPRTHPDPRTLGFFKDNHTSADGWKVPVPSLAKAFTWLSEAVEEARMHLAGAQVPVFIGKGPLNFGLLRITLTPRSPSGPRPTVRPSLQQESATKSASRASSKQTNRRRPR